MGRERILGSRRVRFVHLYHLLLVLLLGYPAITLGQKLILTPSLSVGERYDDNIFQREQDEEDDFITVITPGIDLVYTPTALTTIDLMYHPSLEFFADNSDENQVAHRFALGVRSPLTRRLSLNLRERLVVTDEPQDRDRNQPLLPGEDPEPIPDDPDGGTRDESHESRERTIRNLIDAVLNIQLAARTSLGLLFESLIEDVNVDDEVDEYRYGVGANLGYLTSVARRNRVSLAYDVTFFTFRRNSDSPDAADAEDFQAHAVTIGYLHNFTSTLATEGRVGYAFTDSDDADFDESTTFVGSLDLTKSLRTGVASLRYERDFTSGRGQGGVVLFDRFLAVFASRISPKITARLQGDVSLFDFQEEDRNDRLFFAVRPSLVYEVLRFWRLSLTYDFELNMFDESDEPDRTNHRLTFISQFILRRGLSLDLTYQFRARRFDGAQPADGGQRRDEFDRNEVMLSITYAPTLRFF